MTQTQTIHTETKQAKTRAPKRGKATLPKQVKAKTKSKKAKQAPEQVQQAEATPTETPKQAQPAPAETPKPVSKLDQDRGTFVLRVTTTRPSFAEQIPEGSFLRRDQPRKPGDSAKYRGVERERAIVYKSRAQVAQKLAELASLYDGLAVEVVEA